MSMALETGPVMQSSPSSSLSDPADGFVMVETNPSSLNSDDSEVLKQSLNQDQGSVSSTNRLPRCVLEGTKEKEMLDRIFTLAKENEELKETLKHNNQTLQKHINDVADMQDKYKRSNEAVKKEHQKAREVVKKLRDENRSLKEEVKSQQLQNGDILRREKEIGLERENNFLKQQIATLQEQITHIDQEIKDCQFTETVTENWQHLLGSIASYEYQSGTLLKNQQDLSTTESITDAGNLQDKYAKLETEKEILNVDFDKMKVEKDHMEEQLLQLLEEHKKLQISFDHVNEEKEEFHKMLIERDSPGKKEQQEKLEEKVGILEGKANSLSEKLKKETKKRAEAEEDRKKCAMEYEKQIAKLKEDFSHQLKQMELKSVQKSTEDEEDDDSVSKEKYEGVKMLYLKYERQVMENEEKENKLHCQLKNIEKEKQKAEQKLLETKGLIEAELESRSETYREKLNQLHSELEEGRNREENIQQQLENLRSELEEERNREKTLQEQLEQLQSKLEDRGTTEESLQDQVCHLIQENDSMNVKIEKLTELNARRDTLYEERMKGIEKEANKKELEMHNIIEMLKTQLGKAKEENKRYIEQSHVYKMEHDRLAVQYDSLTKEYDELLNTYNASLEDNRNKRSNASAQIEDYKRQMDHLTAEMSGAAEAIQKKDFLLSKAGEDLQELQRYKDKIPILEQQLEVYRNDFQAEREARERQHADLLQLREDNQGLQQANEELQRDLDNLANNQMAEMQRRHGSHVPHHSVINPHPFRNGFFRRGGDPDPREEMAGDRNMNAQGQPPYHQQHQEEPYPCHGCRNNFDRFSDLEAHVRECAAALHGNGPPHPGVGNSQPECPKCGQEFPDIDTLQIHVLECLDS